jgi:hypothetical protein
MVLNAPFFPKRQYFPKLTHDLSARIDAFSFAGFAHYYPRCCNMFPAKIRRCRGSWSRLPEVPSLFAEALRCALHVIEATTVSIASDSLQGFDSRRSLCQLNHPPSWRNTDAADAEPSYAGSKSSICQTQYREAAAQKNL